MDLAQTLREMGAPEEIITIFGGGPSKDEIVSRAFRKLEDATDNHKRSANLTGNRSEDFHFMYSAWVESLIRTFTEGGVSFKSIASAMAAMELKIMMLEDTLRENGMEVPREPSNGVVKRCEFCGGNH